MESPWIEILSLTCGLLTIMLVPLVYWFAPDWTLKGYRFLVGMLVTFALIALFSFLMVWWLVWIGLLLPLGILLVLYRNTPIETHEEW